MKTKEHAFGFVRSVFTNTLCLAARRVKTGQLHVVPEKRKSWGCRGERHEAEWGIMVHQRFVEEAVQKNPPIVVVGPHDRKSRRNRTSSGEAQNNGNVKKERTDRRRLHICAVRPSDELAVYLLYVGWGGGPP